MRDASDLTLEALERLLDELDGEDPATAGEGEQ